LSPLCGIIEKGAGYTFKIVFHALPSPRRLPPPLIKSFLPLFSKFQAMSNVFPIGKMDEKSSKVQRFKGSIDMGFGEDYFQWMWAGI